MRKNLLVQHTRFVNSGNRQGATFDMEVGVGDRRPRPRRPVPR